MACAVIAMIGTAWSRTADSGSRIRCVASKPSISGIWTSISTSLYGTVSSDRIASAPSAHGIRPKPQLLEDAEGHLLVGDVVLGEQDPKRAASHLARRVTGDDASGGAADRRNRPGWSNRLSKRSD